MILSSSLDPSKHAPTDSFNINDHIEFCSTSIRSSTDHKLKHHLSHSIISKHFYFHWLPHLWNSLPPIDLDLSIETIKGQLIRFFWSHFQHHFDPSNVCTFHYLCQCSKCSFTRCTPNFHNYLSLWALFQFMLLTRLLSPRCTSLSAPPIYHSYHHIYYLYVCAVLKSNNNNNNNKRVF